jgi:type VI secretion system protein ImpJ
MLLQPQHFQQQDRYHEARVQRYLHWLSPFCWGVKTLVINETALHHFLFEVQQCELVTWDGTLVRLQSNTLPSNAILTPRAFEAFLDPGGAPLGVYLGVKRLQWEALNVSFDNGTETETLRRFTLREVDTPDLLTGDGQHCVVHYLMHEVRLLFTPEVAMSTHDYELVKIAEVQHAAEGQGALLSRHYIPPALSVHASPVLVGMLKELRDLLTAKGRELTEYKRQRRVHTIELGSRDTIYVLMMQMVNRYIPLLHHHLEVPETHPCVLYGLLRQLVGEFSTFSETISILGGPVPAYCHEHLWECFDAVVRIAKALLHEMTKGPEYVVPLVFDGTYFATADLDPRFFASGNHYYLAIKVDMPPRDIEHLLTNTGKVCTRQDMEVLRQRALPGLVVHYLETPPEELPRRAHCSYFELDHFGALWRRIEQHHNVAVYCQLPPDKAEMQLLVVSET